MLLSEEPAVFKRARLLGPYTQSVNSRATPVREITASFCFFANLWSQIKDDFERDLLENELQDLYTLIVFLQSFNSIVFYIKKYCLLPKYGAVGTTGTVSNISLQPALDDSPTGLFHMEHGTVKA